MSFFGVDGIHPSLWMMSYRVVRVSDCQFQSRNSPGFDPSVLRDSGIWWAADEAVLKTAHKKSIKIPLFGFFGISGFEPREML
jgi:hypothetical protein